MTQLTAIIAWCLPMLVLQLTSLHAEAISCFKTAVGSTPHKKDCGPLAKACRVLVKPYKVQNNSAVTNCNNDQLVGRYIFDCAVECPEKTDDRSWNEMDCCTGDSCNDGSSLKNVRKCYVSKGNDSPEEDTIQACDAPKRCGVNLKTGETKCLDEAECKGGGWRCCTDDTCINMWGVEKMSMSANEEESTDATNLTPSMALAGACLLAASAAVRSP